MNDYWHGGRRGIAVGDYIRSPQERRGELSPLEYLRESGYRYSGYNADRDPKRVYFTTDRELARGWAMNELLQKRENGGALYRVRPMPPSSVESDPDFAATGFSARRALVLEVVEDPVQMPEEDAIRATCAKYMLWTDGSRMYDDEGWMQPCSEHRAVGVTPEAYRHLGRWFRLMPWQVVVWRNGRVSVSDK